MSDSLEGLPQERILELARFGSALLNHKDTREPTLRLAKTLNPNFRNAEIDAKDEVAKAVQPVLDENKKLREEMIAEAQRRDSADLTRRLKEKGFDIVAVEKVMEEKHIADYDTALTYMRMEGQLAPATPALVDSGNVQMPEGFKEIAKNPARWAREQAAKIRNEFAQQRAGLV